MNLEADSLKLIALFESEPAVKEMYAKFVDCMRSDAPRRAEKFIKTLEKMLPKVPKELTQLRASGQILLAHQKFLAEDFPGAEAAYLAAAALAPQLAVAFYGAGRCRQKCGYYYSATRHFLSALALAPENSDYQYELGVSYFFHQDYPAARDCLAQMIARGEQDHARVYYHYALVLERQCATDAAVINYMKALSLAPGDAEILYALKRAKDPKNRRGAVEKA